MTEVIITNLVEIMAAIFKMLLIVFGAWISAKLGKRTELQNINQAQFEVIRMAQITVGELQQTLVEELKNASADGKLQKEQMEALGAMLIEKVMEKMSQPTYNLLDAAGVDIVKLITGAGEAWIAEMKKTNQ